MKHNMVRDKSESYLYEIMFKYFNHKKAFVFLAMNVTLGLNVNYIYVCVHTGCPKSQNTYVTFTVIQIFTYLTTMIFFQYIN